MTARELFQAGKLEETVQALMAELRDNPGDVQRRTFLFEALCFAGDYERAEKQLEVLSKENERAGLGGVMYRAAIHAERIRLELFAKKEYPTSPGEAAGSEITGSVNGKSFTSIADADPRIGPRLEVFAAGAYLWLPFRHIKRLDMAAPKRLRDLLWIPAKVLTGPAFKGQELGEVLLPALTVSAVQSKDNAVRLGRETHWEELKSGEVVPVGQKMLLVDGEDFPILEVRTLEIASEKAAPA